MSCATRSVTWLKPPLTTATLYPIVFSAQINSCRVFPFISHENARKKGIFRLKITEKGGGKTDRCARRQRDHLCASHIRPNLSQNLRPMRIDKQRESSVWTKSVKKTPSLPQMCQKYPKNGPHLAPYTSSKTDSGADRFFPSFLSKKMHGKRGNFCIFY